MNSNIRSDKSLWVDARLLNKSGIGRYIAEILPLLHESFDLTCIVGPEGLDFVKDHGIKFRLTATGIYAIKEQFELPKLIESCDLFWSPHFNIPLFPIKAKKRLVTIHDAYHLAYANKLSFKERIYARLFYNMAIRQSDAVITVSEFSKSELLKYTSNSYAGKIKVILNGVSTFDTLDAFAETPSRDYFLFVGNIKPHKNLKNAILAFKGFCIAHPELDYRFVIVGQQSGFINADQEVETLLFEDELLRKHIEFTGFVDDNKLKMLYQGARSLIFPSIYEGFGLPPLEAMLLGTPAIVSAVASMPELCGDAVLYFDPLSVASIQARIEEIATDDRVFSALVLKGKDQALKYNWTEAALQHRTLIQELMNTQ